MKFCGNCGRALKNRCPQSVALRTSHNQVLRRVRRAPGSVRDGDHGKAIERITDSRSARRPRRKSRRRAQDGDGAVRRYQGLDRADGGPRSRRGARDYRSGAEADDRRGRIATTATSCRSPATASSRCSARRSRTRTIRSARSMRALRMQEELRRYSAKVVRDGGSSDRGAVSASTPAKWWSGRSRPARVRSSTRRSGIPPTWRRGCRRRRRPVRSRSARTRASCAKATSS